MDMGPLFAAGQQVGNAVAGGAQAYQQARMDRLGRIAQMAIMRFNAGDFQGAHALAQTMNGALGLAGPKLIPQTTTFGGSGGAEDGSGAATNIDPATGQPGQAASIQGGPDFTNPDNIRAIAGELGVPRPTPQFIPMRDGTLAVATPGYPGQAPTISAPIRPQPRPVTTPAGAVTTMPDGSQVTNPKPVAPARTHYHTAWRQDGSAYLVEDGPGVNLGTPPTATGKNEAQLSRLRQGMLTYRQRAEQAYVQQNTVRKASGAVVKPTPDQVKAAGDAAEREYRTMFPELGPMAATAPVATPAAPTPANRWGNVHSDVRVLGAQPAPADSSAGNAADDGTDDDEDAGDAVESALPGGAQPASYSPAVPPTSLLGKVAANRHVAQWQSQIQAASDATGVPPDVLAAVMEAESNGNPSAKSPAGAIGLMQLMPGTAKDLGVDPTDPRQNILGGALYLRQQAKAFGGDLAKTLAAYNAGPGAVSKYNGVPPYAETRRYVNNILSRLRSTPAAKAQGAGNPMRMTSAPAMLADLYQRYGIQPGAADAVMNNA